MPVSRRRSKRSCVLTGWCPAAVATATFRSTHLAVAAAPTTHHAVPGHLLLALPATARASELLTRSPRSLHHDVPVASCTTPLPMAPRLLACFGRRGGGVTAAADEAMEDPQQQAAPGPVLVELFASQGCGASPEADAVAARLAQDSAAQEGGGPAVVVLAFHVDYWDHSGWKDPFASSAWTVRQKAYVEALRLDTLFTPQVVVQGRAHCVGTDQDALAQAVRDAPRYPAPAMKVTFQRPSPTTLQASFTGALRSRVEGAGGASVLAALYESGLVTDCGRGENKGKSLLNDHVVRRLEKVAAVREGASARKAVSGTVQFALWDGFRAAKCGVVLFVQNAALQVLGVQHFDLPDNV